MVVRVRAPLCCHQFYFSYQLPIFFFSQMKTLYLGVYGSAGGGGMWRSWRAEFLVGVPEGVAEPLPGLLVG